MSERRIQGRRRSSTLHYQTFDTTPPKSRGPPNSGPPESPADVSQHSEDAPSQHQSSRSPLPVRQMLVLAMIALAEQTALNSISPYLPDMASTFPEVEPSQVGVYVGTIASAFALAQFATNYFWGSLSDRIGRKPVILLGTILTALCFVAFGFCKTLGQAIAVQALMGVVNGNQGLVSTCLGEITDRSNQSKAFTWLPVLYGIGGITGPLVGGLLVFKQNPFTGKENPYPFLAPNLVSAAILLVDFGLTAFFMEESLEDAGPLPQFGKKLRRKFRNLFTWLWQFTGLSQHPTYLRVPTPTQDDTDTIESEDHDSDLDSASEISTRIALHEPLTWREFFTRDTVLLLLTYLIFALCNVSFNSLFPIFTQAKPPAGRNLTPSEIGLSQGFAGFVTIAFQICVFNRLRGKMGNRWSYRAGLFGFGISFLLMPFVGYKSESAHGLTRQSALMAVELCSVLLIKTVASVGGLTSALLLITNSAPNHAVLGALNGLAQTLSAAGRSVGPFLSGGLFTLTAKIQPRGEALAFGVFGAVSFIGFLLSFGIRAQTLEADGLPDNASVKSDEEEPIMS
ncbi:Major facilitator superfamily domain general substrate transporter [Penicillium longicatenatum]|uniref:Major facilitator superfamily domain general substrate transporter n=1 Tax=Penicillium longicatenatum TaxID=1561947 RepID=UPI002548C88C|nr:Major facilitator superfamily domain general substrate transporter [Penicillium longicatenatum]KAJ5657601.1 Major facilitator superfamily domain general substrate transporter [Penicillium longicatenatum]